MVLKSLCFVKHIQLNILITKIIYSKAKYMGKHVKGQKNYANISRIISPSTSVSLSGNPLT